jgi:hypothetical protein
VAKAEMLLHTIDGASNFVYMKKGTILTGRGAHAVKLEYNAYIINSNDHLFYASMSNTMTEERAKKFLLSTLGLLPEGPFCSLLDYY